MPVGSTLYLGFLAVVLLLGSFLQGRDGRNLLVAAASALFFATQSQGDLTRLVWTGCFALAGFAAARWLRARPSTWGLFASVGILVGAFLILKDYFGLASALGLKRSGGAAGAVGLSYILFRMIHLAVDARQGQLTQLSLRRYLSYQFSFLTLVAGPLQRFEQHERDVEKNDVPTETIDSLLHWHRLLLGIIKIAISGFLWTRLEAHSTIAAEAQSLALAGWQRAAFLFYGFPAYIYLNFSGYCDTVIGTGRLLGLRLPENFDRPFLAFDMIDFWNRWHITLSAWIRDYVFNPTYAALAVRRVPRTRAAYASLFLALFLAGLWHGSSTELIAFGSLHGLGAAASQWLRNRRGRGFDRTTPAAGSMLSRALTLNYVCLTFLFLPPLARERRIYLLALMGLGH